LFVITAFGRPRALARIASDVGPPRVASQFHSGALDRSNGPARTLQLLNSSWNQIKVEVRVGPTANCDAFQSLGVYVLQRGQEWKVQFDDPVICWRRDQTPGDPSSTWAAWHLVNLADAEIRAVTL